VSSAVLLPASFAILLAGALLFTNAIECFGSMVGLGQGAVGSVLAAVATALPESLIPVVAIIGGEAGSEDVATGAILGAPLLLATVPMVLVGVSALIYRDRRPQRLACSVHFPTLERDLAFFMGCFFIGLLLGLGAPTPLQVAGAVLLVLAYLLYVVWTATELPEKANSFFWVREGKDSLALGNITGAMVFQSTIPVSIGLAFTAWELDSYSILAGCLALAGGFVAIVTLQIRRRFSGRAIVLWATLYAVFAAYVVAMA
jgi:Ca2+/Na+ antiporter